MKAIKVTIQNIGIIADAEIEINKPLIIFYGNIRTGKTTILKAIKLLFGGGFSNDLIKHGKRTAFVQLDLDNGYIKREWYINNNNQVTAMKIEYVKDGKLVTGRVIDEIAKIVNPFQLDQNFFRNMNKPDRNKYLLDIFHVDITDLQKEKKELEDDAKELRQKIKLYGDIDLTPINRPNIDELRKREQEIRTELNGQYIKNKKHNEQLRKQQKEDQHKLDRETETFNNQQVEYEADLRNAHNALEILNNLGYQENEVSEWIKTLPVPQSPRPPETVPDPKFITEIPDQTRLNVILEQIGNAKADQIKYKQYLDNVEKDKQRNQDKLNLTNIEQTLKDNKKEAAKRLQQISDKIPGLIFDENGDFTYLDTASDMLSDSMEMELSSELSALYPEGLKLELIDQGESLGLHKKENIQKLIDHAKNNKRNVLVTKVGDKDTDIPDEVGVFVVKEGSVT